MPQARSPMAESVLRALTGLFVLLDVWQRLLPLETNFRPWSACSILLAILLAVGYLNRVAALGLFCIWWLRPVPFDEWQLDAGVSLLFLAHFCVPRAPFGSASAWGRVDPGEGWTLPGWITNLRSAALFSALPFIALPSVFPLDADKSWEVTRDVAHVSGLSFGILQLVLGCALLPLFFTRRALAWWWLLFVIGACYAGTEPEKSGSLSALVWLLLLTAPLESIPALVGKQPDRVLYDGACALCHATVRWLIAEDADGSRFRFAPQAGTARRLIVETADGQRHEGSTAVLHCWRRLGGLWRLLAEILRWVPRWLRDPAYAAIARVRYVLFGRKSQACPLLPQHLRSRFL